MKKTKEKKKIFVIYLGQEKRVRSGEEELTLYKNWVVPKWAAYPPGTKRPE